MFIHSAKNTSRRIFPFIVVLLMMPNFLCAATGNNDITPKIKRFRLNCPLPSTAKCISTRLIPSGYTVLSEKIDVEIYEDSWVIDFRKRKNPQDRQIELRIVSSDGELYVINALFPEEKIAPVPLAPPAVPINKTSSTTPAKEKSELKEDAAQPNKVKKQEVIRPESELSKKEGALINSESFCETLAKDPVVKKYVEILQKFSAFSGKVENYNENRPHFDSADRRLERYVDSKSVDNPGTVSDVLADCALQIKDSKLFPLFGVNLSDLKRYSKDKADRDGARQKQNVPGNIKQIDAKIGVSSNPFLNSRSRKVVLSNGDTPLLSALMFQDGKDEVKSIEKEVFDDLNKKLASLKANQDGIQKREAERKKSVVNLAARLKKISSGDLRVAKSCFDIAVGLEANMSDQLLPAISPSKEVRAITAMLLDYDENELIKSGQGKLSVNNNFGMFKTGAKTQWFGKDEISPGNSKVFVVGRYVANEQVKLTNGSVKKASVFEALCVSPDSKSMSIDDAFIYMNNADELEKELSR
ncbi:hypothetical protein GBK02_15860 [Dechloromonas sp. TW-R-39-2]|uniref:hypothetical protein n=1 Tax=Dechloromonas sp. TW-R-39-2 TaxID=2654218 RepID=UPI00193D7D20|nr:hypothetical protein [Dechloromonas sp. TW-R-39-2]QRM20745.1 hypothetical protein GBK02_15860 [Dechloromonas sp. TW-R-39-2]